MTLTEQDFRCDAFISYRRSDAAPFAKWLRRRLQDHKLTPKFAEGRNRPRIYLDTVMERATNDFWDENIEPELMASRYLLVIATPKALEGSITSDNCYQNWVTREIESFEKQPQGRNVLVVRAKGEATDRLPGDLQERFPRANILDMRAFASLLGRIFLLISLPDKLVTILGALYEIESEMMPDLRVEEAHRARTRAIGLGIIATTLFVLIISLAITAVIQRNHARANLAEAQRQAAIALSRQLAAESELLGSEGTNLEPAALLAAESMERLPMPENDRAIRVATRLLPHWLWSVKLGAPIATVAFSPNGRYVAAGNDYGAAYVLEALSPHKVSRLTAGEVPAAPGGLGLAVQSAPRIPLSHPSGAGVNAVAFSPDGRYVATGSNDGTARVFEAVSGKEVSRLTEQGEVSSVAFSPDGRYVATGSGDGTARVFEALSGKEVSRLTGLGGVHSVVFSPDGHLVATGSMDGTARVFDSKNGKEVSELIAKGDIPEVAFSPDGKYVATASFGSEGGTSGITFNAENDFIVRLNGKTNNRIGSIELSPDGRPVFISETSSHNAPEIFEATTGRVLRRLVDSGPVYSVAFSPDGRNLATGSWNGIVRVFDVASGTQLLQLTDRGTVSALAFSPNGQYIVVGSWSRPTSLFEVSTGKEVLRLTQQGGVDALAFSPNGQLLVTGGDGMLRFFNAINSDEGPSLVGKGRIFAASLSPDDRYVALARTDGDSQVFEAASAKQLLQFTPPTES